MKRSIFVVLVALVVLTGVADASDGLGVRWPGRSPVQIRLIDASPPDWQAAVQAEVGAWNQSPVLHINYEVGPCVRPDQFRGILVCVDDAGPNEGSGSTYLEVKGRSIRYAGILLNTYWLPSPNYMVICQELGHALGLDHQPNGSGSCMSGGADWPNAYDYQELGIIY
jgi:hypothetical protein